MSELSPRTRALLDASRTARNPSPQQLEHVRHSLLARLAAGATAVGYGATVATASAASGIGLGAKAIAVAAVALGGWGGFQWATQSAAQPAPLASPADRVPAPRQAASEVAVAAPAAEPAAAEPAAPTEPVSPRVAPRAASSSAQRSATEDSLLEEARMLGEVQKALGAGQVADALSRLNEYDARYPRGSLRVEAEAARVLALCQGGSSGPGRAAAQRFLKRYPASPAASRVRQACSEPVR